MSSWPPVCDDTCVPALDEPYWFRELETEPPEVADARVVQAEADLATSTRPEKLAAFRERLARELRVTIGVRATVRVEEPGALPRTQFKARRVVDNRDLYRQATGRAEGLRAPPAVDSSTLEGAGSEASFEAPLE